MAAVGWWLGLVVLTAGCRTGALGSGETAAGERAASAPAGATAVVVPSEAAEATTWPTVEPTPEAERVVRAVEVAVTPIPVGGSLADGAVVLAGLAWYEDTLVMLPRFPDRATGGSGAVGSDTASAVGPPDEEGALGPADGSGVTAEARLTGDGTLYALTRADVEATLNGASGRPLRPREIALDTGGVERRVNGFAGFEAIAFDGPIAYVALAGRSAGVSTGYLALGHLAPDGRRLALDATSLVEVPLPVPLDGPSVAALVVTRDQVVALFEANGERVNPAPLAWPHGPALTPLASIGFPTLEYRLTDATAPDGDRRFWVTNVYHPKEADRLPPAPDLLAARHGQGATHAANAAVERLIELEYRAGGIVLTDTAPVQLELTGHGDMSARRWTGIVRLEGHGFLLAAADDTGPRLGLVPHP